MSESATKVELVDYDPDLGLFAQTARQNRVNDLDAFVAESTENDAQAMFLKELIQREWWCCQAAESELLHRGQAIKGELKAQGHKIEKEWRDGRRGYVHKGYERIPKAGKYKQMYYTTRHWVRIARLRKQMDGFRCRQCGSANDLETHHHRYELFNEDVKHDLITYCKACHERVHKGASGGRLHFPHRITEDIIRRIIADQIDLDDEEVRKEFYAA